MPGPLPVAGRRVSLQYALLSEQSLPALARAWLPRLPAARRARIERLREAADRAATLAGVALLAAACRALGCGFDAASLEYPARGKPRLPGGPQFSIAHAGGLVACAAVAGGCIGLDVEADGVVDAGRLRLVLDAAERAALAAGELAPTDAWVMKEAVLKAAGYGAAQARRVRLRRGRAWLDGKAYLLTRVRLSALHVSWLATDGAAPALEARHARARELI